MRLLPFAVLFATGFAVAAPADDAVAFKLAQPKPGDRVRVSQSEKAKRTRTTETNGKKSVATEQAATAWVYVGEILKPEGKDDEPRVKRTYEKYEAATNGKPEAGPPLNVAILIEKKDDRYVFSAGKHQLPPAFVARLEPEFGGSTKGSGAEDMLPEKPVKTGDTWKIDPAKAFRGTGKIALDADNGTMTGKLVKTYKKDGRQYATLEYAASAPIKSLGPGATLVPKEGSVAELKLTADACIDGTNPYSRTTARVTFRVEAKGQQGESVLLVSESTRSETIELLPAKK